MSKPKAKSAGKQPAKTQTHASTTKNGSKKAPSKAGGTTPVKAAVSSTAPKGAKAAPAARPALATKGGAPRLTKQARLIDALRKPAGVSIAELVTLTGWQAHTVRGTMSGVLRKRLGLTVKCGDADAQGTRRYRIVPEATA